MRSLFLAAVLALHLGLGISEADDGISELLYNYAAYYGDYLYATGEYYTENITLIPTIYPYGEEYPSQEYPSQEYPESGNAGSALRCHLPLLILLSLLVSVL